MSTRCTFVRGLVALALFGLAASANAAVLVIDDFEAGEGHFAQQPGFSGTSAGFEPAATVSTADRVTDEFFAGAASERLFINDNTTNAPDGTAWRVRFLSGGGTPANNVTLPTSGYVGYWLKTSNENLRAAIMVDDGAALERSTRVPIIADNQWHLYQWNFDDDAQWDGFAGTGPNGVIDAASVTLDSLYIDAVLVGDGSDQDATLLHRRRLPQPRRRDPHPRADVAGGAGAGRGRAAGTAPPVVIARLHEGFRKSHPGGCDFLVGMPVAAINGCRAR